MTVASIAGGDDKPGSELSAVDPLKQIGRGYSRTQFAVSSFSHGARSALNTQLTVKLRRLLK